VTARGGHGVGVLCLPPAPVTEKEMVLPVFCLHKVKNIIYNNLLRLPFVSGENFSYSVELSHITRVKSR
jgi:hypothetical protein